MASTLHEELFEAERLMCLGASYSAIERALKSKFRCGRARARRVVESVFEAWVDTPQVQANLEQRRAQHRARLEALLVRAYAKNQLPTAAGVLAQLAKLDGLAAPEKLEVSAAGAGELNPDAVRGRIAEILRARPDLAKDPS